MRTIVDTNILIDVIRNHAAAIEFLERAASQGEVVSITPVRTELLWGVRPREEVAVERLIGRIRWIDITVSIADHAGTFGRTYGKSHRLGIIDALLAAAAEEVDGTVATLNVRHFPMFPGLQPPY